VHGTQEGLRVDLNQGGKRPNGPGLKGFVERWKEAAQSFASMML